MSDVYVDSSGRVQRILAIIHLGIVIEPAEVQLVPSVDDFYVWKVSLILLV